ncbi:MAG: hypothetical protein LBR06_00610 [Bacteroidales bacterium]|jgi:hypothetical protein|nr:hypothetical protein [Bacteroidales bacterium]
MTELVLNGHIDSGKLDLITSYIRNLDIDVAVKQTRQSGKAKKAAVPEEDTPLYKSLDRAFHDVREIIDGKQVRKTAKEFLYELRNSNCQGVREQI